MLLSTQARRPSHWWANKHTEHWQPGRRLWTLPIPAWCLKGMNLLGWSTLRLISSCHHGYADIAYSSRSCRGRVNKEDLQQQLLGVISCSCDGSGQLMKTLWLQIWLFIPSSTQLQLKAFTGYSTWVIAHLCARLTNTTATNQAREEGFWDLALLHLPDTRISGICAKCIWTWLSSAQELPTLCRKCT